MIAIAPQFTQRFYKWTPWKAANVLKGGSIQYDDDGNVYTIYFYDGPEAHICTIWQGTLPDSVVNGGYTQAQNDSDKADFEGNYKPASNAAINPTSIRLPGYVTTTTTSFSPVRATFYTEPSSGAQRSVSSSSATDTSAGTGARTVKITYYDSTLTNLKTETVTLNGTSTVNTAASDICFIEKMEVITVGSNGGNAGTITLFGSTAGGGGTIGTIPTGDNQTNWCHHYVRANRTNLVTGVAAGGKGTSSASVVVRKSFPTASPAQAELNVSQQLRVPAGSQMALDFSDAPLVVVGPARITLYVQQDAASGTNTWYAGFGYYEN